MQHSREQFPDGAAPPAPDRAGLVGAQRRAEVGPSAPPATAERGAVGRLADTVAQLRRQLDEAQAHAAGRSVVEMAVGILVERLRCGPTEAAKQLQVLAEQAGSTPLELAADLVNRAAADKISEAAHEFVARAAQPVSSEVGVRLRNTEADALSGGDAGAAARAMLEHALRPLGAVAVAIWAAHPDLSLSLAGSAGFADAEARRWRHVPPGVVTVARRALDERAPVAYRTLADGAVPTVGGHEAGGGRLAVPAGVGGRLIGVLEVCWRDELPEQSQSLQRQFEALAELCATTLESWDADTAVEGPVGGPFNELAELVDGVLDPCMILDPVDGFPPRFVIRHANPAFVDFAGRPTSAIVGAGLLEAYPLAAQGGNLLEAVENVHATGAPFKDPRMRLTALVDGVPLSTDAYVSINRHRNHVIVLWRLAESTSQIARLLHHAQRLGRIGGFEEDLDSRQVVWNDTLFELHGLSPTAQPVPLDRLSDHAHPDDREAVQRFLRTLLHHRRPASTAFRLQRADGVTRHIRVVAEPVHDRLDRLGTVRGAYQDISAQHWTEVALAATRDQLAQTEQQVAERHRLVRQLQHAIMPPSAGPRTLHNLDVAVRYRPAEKDHLVGGDWYDALPLPSGQVLVCVGDVAGHGIEAATGMVALRNALRGLAATGAGPAQLLAWLNSVTHHLTDNVTATAVCGLYDPDRRHLRWARAGHLPPVLLRGGDAECLPQADGILLGVLDQADYEEREIALEPGDRIVMYTDGLIERRDQGLHASLADLVALSRSASRQGVVALDAHLDHLLRFSGADTDDDTCLVGMEVR
ncbi:SpoIIE family protein phosphatase [Streptomyces sp. TLI_171]|uniref:SpoIIE family protein phosphatase n=1 Tax=Streptomyces sp. TLI_171 TaxID=1938859 RepID=UPI000C5AA522|nr:SpoIIE family protein phosphatase [Streptomyces sp. TLI_171]RKE16887.1 PAS domain S-box-containing protein [Streptomyces sp. TLI_171]